MDPAGISDLKTVVTEACMNVVVHAYPDETGPLKVDAEPLDDVVRIRIVDRGVGFQPRPTSTRRVRACGSVCRWSRL